MEDRCAIRLPAASGRLTSLTDFVSAQCVYFGDVGEDASVLNAYLEKNGAPVPADAYVLIPSLLLANPPLTLLSSNPIFQQHR